MLHPPLQNSRDRYSDLNHHYKDHQHSNRTLTLSYLFRSTEIQKQTTNSHFLLTLDHPRTMAPVTELPIPKAWPFQKDCLVDSKNQIWDSSKEEIIHLEGAQAGNPETWNIIKFCTLHYPQVEFRSSGTQHDHTWGQSKGQILHLHSGPNLTEEEALVSNHIINPFYIEPCETHSMNHKRLVVGFRYWGETIASAYEGAGWAFETPHGQETPWSLVHHQGFKILRHSHFLIDGCTKHIFEALSSNFNFFHHSHHSHLHFHPMETWYFNHYHHLCLFRHFTKSIDPVDIRQWHFQRLFKKVESDLEWNVINDVYVGRLVKRRRVAAIRSEAKTHSLKKFI